MLLAEIGSFKRGSGLQKTDFVPEGYPCIHYGEIYTYYNLAATKTKSFITEDLALKLKKAHKDDLIITTTSENMDDVCKAMVWEGDNDVAIGGHEVACTTSLNSRFLAYWLQTKEFYSQKKKLARGTKVIEISAKNLGKILVPIPPLSEQQRIVDILDKFDALVNDISQGLPAEIEARRKQYEYYRDKLLTFKKKEV